jgi:prophage regulatory protein
MRAHFAIDPESLTMTATLPTTILRLVHVKARTGLSRSTIYLRIKDGSFPTPIALGPRSVGWLEADVEAWIEARVRQSRIAPLAR